MRLKRVVGLAVGERSLLAAEVVAGTGGPEVRRAAEFVYPDGVSPKDSAALGEALGAFLRDNQFTAKAAVVGLPARWLVVKSKDVPPADPGTLAELLRLQAEGEFSSELKDLVYDYAADATAGHPKSVLLIATPQRYVDGAVAMCDAAKLTAAAVTPSAVALGSATGAAGNGQANALVLNVGTGGAELTVQSGTVPCAIRHLRGPTAAVAGADAPAVDKSFIGELRRTVSALPGGAANGTGGGREMILWGGTKAAALDAAALGEGLGLSVRAGELSSLGVTANGAASNGDGRTYAVAVALAMSAMGGHARSIDFLHPRLAPPKPRLVPRWAVLATLSTVAVVGLSVMAWQYLGGKERDLNDVKALNDKQKDGKKAAAEFVNRVTFAKAFQGGTPRYLDCYRDVTMALMPLDDRGSIYATQLTLQESPRQSSVGTTAAEALKAGDGPQPLKGTLVGKVPNQGQVDDAVRRLRGVKAFSDVQLKSTTEGVGANRERQVTYTISFTYTPHPAAAPMATPQPHK